VGDIIPHERCGENDNLCSALIEPETWSILHVMDTRLLRANNPASPLIVLNTFGNEGEAVHAAVRSASKRDFSLLVVSGMDWNRDLSPWEATAVFKNDAPFGGKADEFLDIIEKQAIPDAVSELGNRPEFIAIAGYSLAGLFAIYSLYMTDVFSRAASASGSFWFPGFIDFSASHEFVKKPEKLYLSLGEQEARTRNPVMATVQENTEKLAELYRGRGIDTTFELNPGNHFKDPALRMAKGIRSILET